MIRTASATASTPSSTHTQVGVPALELSLVEVVDVV
jgi:hypothetical protein